MTHQEFDQLVSRVEKEFAGRTGALRNRILFWAILGYLAFLGWFAGVALIAAAFLIPGIFFWPDGWVFLLVGGIILIGGIWSATHTLYLSIEPPKGREITRSEVPSLFQCLDEIQSRCGSRPFHAVIISPEFNAGVTEQPRLGVFGWWKKYLTIGLPLLDILSESEVRAVLAHEFAHVSHEHGRLSHWMYRLRRSWDNLFQQYLNRPVYENEISGRVILRKFLHWYWPRFNAYAFVLSRSQEYMADSLAARITSPQTTALALARLRLCSGVIGEKFWPDLWQLAKKTEAPPSDIFERLPRFVSAKTEGNLHLLLPDALRVVTTNADTHPCLSERIGALGVSASDLVSSLTSHPADHSATRGLLGNSAAAIRREVNTLWCKEASEAWKQNFARGVSLEHRLHSIESVVSRSGADDAEALWDKARTSIELHGDASGEPHLRQVLAINPSHALANFHLGRLLLSARNVEGETHLERAIAEDSEVLPAACELLFEYYRDKGDHARLGAIRQRLDEHEARLAASARERQNVSASDTFIPHELGLADVESVRALLRNCPSVVQAWLVRKQLKYFPKQQFFLLCLCIRKAWHFLPDTEEEERVVRQLASQLRLPGRVLVFATSGPFRSVARKVRSVSSSELLLSR